MHVVEIFAGCGGLSAGFRAAGCAHRLLVEWNERCCDTLRRNGFQPVRCEDARTVDFRTLGHVDMLIGSPPCQPFSIGGHMRGEEDERNGWDVALRATRELRPKAICFENVSTMLSERFRSYVSFLTEEFSRLGYATTFHNVDCADYGVPQRRKRCFCIAFREDVCSEAFKFPEPQARVTVRQALANMPELGTNRHELHAVTPRKYKGHTGSVLDKPSKTIVTAKNGCGGGSNTITLDDGTFRRYTVREAARIMTFDDAYQFDPTWSRAFTELGNAVPPRVARLIAEAMCAAIAASSARPSTDHA